MIYTVGSAVLLDLSYLSTPALALVEERVRAINYPPRLIPELLTFANNLRAELQHRNEEHEQLANLSQEMRTEEWLND